MFFKNWKSEHAKNKPINRTEPTDVVKLLYSKPPPLRKFSCLWFLFNFLFSSLFVLQTQIEKDTSFEAQRKKHGR